MIHLSAYLIKVDIFYKKYFWYWLKQMYNLAILMKYSLSELLVGLVTTFIWTIDG